jgi:hypothetical protein
VVLLWYVFLYVYVYVWLRALEVGPLWWCVGAKDWKAKCEGDKRSSVAEDYNLDVYTNGFCVGRSDVRVYHKQHPSFRICCIKGQLLHQMV